MPQFSVCFLLLTFVFLHWISAKSVEGAPCSENVGWVTHVLAVAVFLRQKVYSRRTCNSSVVKLELPFDKPATYLPVVFGFVILDGGAVTAAPRQDLSVCLSV